MKLIANRRDFCCPFVGRRIVVVIMVMMLFLAWDAVAECPHRASNQSEDVKLLLSHFLTSCSSLSTNSDTIR